jgi:hypothetical protein
MSKFLEHTNNEIKSRRSLIKHLDENYKECIDDAFRFAKSYEIMELYSRKMLYVLLEKAYGVYLHCSENGKARKYLDKLAEARGIRKTEASDLSIVVVKMLFKFPEKSKSPYQYAAALRYATLKKIPPDGLAKELEKKGNGIDKWEERLARAIPKKARAAALKSSAQDAGDDDPDWDEDDAEGC